MVDVGRDGVIGRGLAQGAALWRRQWVRLATGAVAALIVLASALHAVHSGFSGGDLTYFLARIRDLQAGHDPYAAVLSQRLDAAGDYNDVFLYTPALYYLLSPLTLVSFTLAWNVWGTLNALFLMAGVVALTKAVRPGASVAVGLLLAAPMAWTSMARFELYFGNVDVLLLFLLATSFYLARRRHPIWAGVLLGLVPVVYLQATPFLLFYLWKREYRTLVTGVVTFVVVEAVGFALAPAGTLGHFWAMFQYFIGDWSAIYINQSLYAVVRRFFAPTVYSAAPLANLPWLPVACWLLVFAAVLALGARMIRPQPVAAGKGTWAGLEFAAAVTGLCLIFPVLEANTLIISSLIVVPLALFVADAWLSRGAQLLGGWLVVLYVAAWAPFTSLFSRLADHHGLRGGSLVAATLPAVPYLYWTVALAVTCYIALALAAARVRSADTEAAGVAVPAQAGG